MVQCLPCKPIVMASRYTARWHHRKFSITADMDASHVQLKPMFSSAELLLCGPLTKSTMPTYRGLSTGNPMILMPWSHLCVKPLRMSNVRQILEVPRNCNVLSRSATYYAALTRVSSLPPRRRHDILKFLSTFQKASRRPRKGPVTTTHCHVDAIFATN